MFYMCVSVRVQSENRNYSRCFQKRSLTQEICNGRESNRMVVRKPEISRSRRKGEVNVTKVPKQRLNAKWNHGRTEWEWKPQRRHSLLEIFLRGKREEKYLSFSLPPDLQSLTCASYWPKLSKCQSARKPGKWPSLNTEKVMECI